MVIALKEVVLYLLKVGYRLIDGGNGVLETVVGILDVLAKQVAELIEFGLEVGDINLLALGDNQLALIIQTLLGCLNEQGDDGDKELWTDDVHLLVAMRHVDDTSVVGLVVGLEE